MPLNKIKKKKKKKNEKSKIKKIKSFNIKDIIESNLSLLAISDFTGTIQI